MASKGEILAQLKRDELLRIVDAHELEIGDRRVRDQLGAITRARRVDLAVELVELPRDRLKELCRALGLDESGREKGLLVDRLLGKRALEQAGQREREGEGGMATKKKRAGGEQTSLDSEVPARHRPDPRSRALQRSRLPRHVGNDRVSTSESLNTNTWRRDMTNTTTACHQGATTRHCRASASEFARTAIRSVKAIQVLIAACVLTACGGDVIRASGRVRMPVCSATAAPGPTVAECARTQRPLRADSVFSLNLVRAYFDGRDASLLNRLIGKDVIVELERPSSRRGADFHWVRTVPGGLSPSGFLPVSDVPILFMESADHGGLAVHLRFYQSSRAQIATIESALEPLSAIASMPGTSSSAVADLVSRAFGLTRDTALVELEFDLTTSMVADGASCDGSGGLLLCDGMFAVTTSEGELPAVTWNPQQQRLERVEDGRLVPLTGSSYLVFRVRQGFWPTGSSLESARRFFTEMSQWAAVDAVERHAAVLISHVPQSHHDYILRVMRAYRYAHARRSEQITAADIPERAIRLVDVVQAMDISNPPPILVPDTYGDSRDTVAGVLQRICEVVGNDAETFRSAWTDARVTGLRVPSMCAVGADR